MCVDVRAHLCVSVDVCAHVCVSAPEYMCTRVSVCACECVHCVCVCVCGGAVEPPAVLSPGSSTCSVRAPASNQETWAS